MLAALGLYKHTQCGDPQGHTYSKKNNACKNNHNKSKRENCYKSFVNTGAQMLSLFPTKDVDFCWIIMH